MTTCTVCRHADTIAIGEAIIAGQPVRAIADRYGLAKSSVFRHASKCILDQVAAAKREGKLASGGEILLRLADVTHETRELLEQARTANDIPLALKAITRLERQLRLEGELVGELDTAGTARVLVSLDGSPEWLDLRGAVMLALAPYPEARRAVVIAIDSRQVA